jgi:type VI secretion system protein ImpC
VTRDELAADGQLEKVLARYLDDAATDDKPPSLIVCAHAFGATLPDMAVVERLGALGIARDLAFVAGAQGSLVGCEDPIRQPDPTTWTALPVGVAKTWADLRSSPGASAISLAWPRLLLRLPYGRKTDPIESFAFEEVPPTHAHDDYLWGNGAFAVALAVARVHLGESDEIAGDITDLPAFTYEREGERVLKPCAELVLSERALDEVSARGVTPLLSYRNRNAIRLVGLQSIEMRAN